MSDEAREHLDEYMRIHGFTTGAFLEAWSEHVSRRPGSYERVTRLERSVIARAKEIDAERRSRKRD